MTALLLRSAVRPIRHGKSESWTVGVFSVSKTGLPCWFLKAIGNLQSNGADCDPCPTHPTFNG